MTDCLSQSYFLKKKILFILFGFTIGISCVFLQGCSSQSDAAWKTMQLGFRNEASLIEKAPLKNNLAYLRVNINGLDVLLVKGYQDPGSQGPIDVWYSNDGSVLRIQQGRYLGSVGFDQNWHEVSRNDTLNLATFLKTELNPNFNHLPFNHQLSNIAKPLTKNAKKFFSTQSYVVMPSYLVMRDERISTVISSSAPESIPSSFNKYLLNKDVFWVSETPQPSDIFKKKGAGFAWYGFVKNNSGFAQVIGQQCLSKDFCITWTPWPIQP
jgi:hypothetical protein